ncbi:WSCD family member GA21586-like [Haliotis rufescens]|uniref:WSCD family member GA21586-like n=1 Tax=Haliotis rufescens TaxID=6454 RepID=UPI00201EAC57|nr:WSCD family member GA21586-like [Haliotis rufescens]
MMRRKSWQKNLKIAVAALLIIYAVEHILTMNVYLRKPMLFSPLFRVYNQSGSEPHCPSVRLSTRVLPQIALASYPGSGNTWVRHLLQQMTGIATGSIYNDEQLRHNGFPGESLSNGSVVAVKTHNHYAGKDYARAILLIRNPYESMLSLFKLANSNHTGEPSVDRYGKQWGTFTEERIRGYIPLFASWIKLQDVLPIFYDALKQNLTRELVRIKAFLGQSGIKGDVRCALRDSEGHFHRKETGITLEFFYSKKQRMAVNSVIDQMQKMFKDRFENIREDMDTWKL